MAWSTITALMSAAESFSHDGLLDWLKENGDLVHATLVDSEGLRKTICELGDNLGPEMLDPELRYHNVIHLNAAMTWVLMLDAFPGGGEETDQKVVEVRALLAEAVDQRAASFVACAGPLVEALRKDVRDLALRLEPLAKSGQARIVVVELPVGNSIPTRLLEAELGRLDIQSDRIWGAINRNDSKRRGQTWRDRSLRSLNVAFRGTQRGWRSGW